MTDAEKLEELRAYLSEATGLPASQHTRPLLGAGGMVGVSLGTLRWLAAEMETKSREETPGADSR